MGYLSKRRVANTPKDVYRYEYFVECPVCGVKRWVKNSTSKTNFRCAKCAGRQSYQPSKVERSDKRKRGDGYITKQGYHLVYDGTRYVPAQRLAFPDLPSDWVVHHIDGDKLNNKLENLKPTTKAGHRKAHHSLEVVAFELVKLGLIEFDFDNNSYNLSSSMRKLVELISVKTVEALTDDAEGNTVPSPIKGRCNDYPVEEYIRSLMEVRSTQTD